MRTVFGQTFHRLSGLYPLFLLLRFVRIIRTSLVEDLRLKTKDKGRSFPRFGSDRSRVDDVEEWLVDRCLKDKNGNYWHSSPNGSRRTTISLSTIVVGRFRDLGTESPFCLRPNEIKTQTDSSKLRGKTSETLLPSNTNFMSFGGIVSYWPLKLLTCSLSYIFYLKFNVFTVLKKVF